MKKAIILLLQLMVWLSVYTQNNALVVRISDPDQLHTHSEIIDHNYKDSVYISLDTFALFGTMTTFHFNNFEYWPVSKHYQIFITLNSDTVYHSQYLNDSLIEKYFYPNGILSSKRIHKYNGVDYFNTLWIYQAYYYENGQLFYKNNPNKRGLRKLVKYYRNGGIAECYQSFYNNKGGIQSTGQQETFFENGQIKSQESHTEYNGESVFRSTEVGVWKYWNKRGELIKEINQNR